jgi:hypothetical protein
VTQAWQVAGRPLTDARVRGLMRLGGAAVLEPRSWAVALAGFLARGGFLLFVLPIVVLPTPTGLATAFGGDIIAVTLATPTTDVIRLTVTVVIVVVGWLVLASMVGATADVALARWGAAAEGGAASGEDLGQLPRPALIVRVALVRLACHLPFAVAAVWAVARIVAAVYQQYISPGDLSVSLPLRVIRSVPDAIVLLLAAWLIGEAVGGLAARRIVLEGRSMPRSIGDSITSLVLRPISTIVALISTIAALAILVVPPLAAAALAWSRLGHDLRAGSDASVLVAETLAFAALWLGALVTTGLAAASRSAVWTWHMLGTRHRADPRAVQRSAAAAPHEHA